jgi:tetratricopeptide (TPR) repeat protein
VRDKESNVEKAIAAFKEALRVRTLDAFPVDYATTQNNLGNAYGVLAGVRDKESNLEKAIAAYEEALRVYTFDAFPVNHAMTQNNLGTAYDALAEVRDKGSNLEKAIAAYEEALRVYTFDAFPVNYAITKSNLGTTLFMRGDTLGFRDCHREALRVFNEYGMAEYADNEKKILGKMT